MISLSHQKLVLSNKIYDKMENGLELFEKIATCFVRIAIICGQVIGFKKLERSE